MEKEKRGFFDGRYGKYLLPGVLLQSVLIGADMQPDVKLFLTARNSVQAVDCRNGSADRICSSRNTDI